MKRGTTWLAAAAILVLSTVGTITPAQASPIAQAEALAARILSQVREAAAPDSEDSAAPGNAPADPIAEATLTPGSPTTIRADGVGVAATISGARRSEPLQLTLTPVDESARASAESETGGVAVSTPVDISARTKAGTDVTQFPPTFDVETDPATGVKIATNVQAGVAVDVAVDAERLAAAGVDLSTLAMYTRESAGEPWTKLPSYFDAHSGTVKAASTHLSSFVVIGVPVVTANEPVIVLDPDNDIAWATSPGASVTEGQFNDALAAQVKALLESQCAARVVVTGSASENLSSDFRAGIAAAANPNVLLTIGFNSLSGTAWGSSSDGGSHVYSRGTGSDDSLANSLVGELPGWTGRPSAMKATTPSLPHAPYAGISGAVAHLEALFMDHSFDRPVIDSGFSSISSGVAKAIANYLEASGGGFDCSNPVTGGWPAKPSQAQLNQWRSLGYQNTLTYGGDPVSFSTGNLVETERLFTLTGTGGSSLPVSLVYNSLDGRLGRAGAGWSFSLGGHAQIFDDGSVMVVRGDGASFVFAPNGSGGFVPDTAQHLTLVNTGSNVLRLTSTATGESWLYDAADIDGIGELTAYTDTAGHTTTLTYGSPNKRLHQFVPLTSITDASGQTVQVGNDSLGRITSFTLPDGRVWRLAYDGSGNLASITNPAGQIRRFTYDVSHRILTMTDAAGITYLTNEYDASGRVLRQFDAESNVRSFDYQANRTVYTDQEGRQTTYNFDSAMRITSIVDPPGRSKSWTFDAANNVTRYVDTAGRATAYSYDAFGNVLTVTDPSSATTRYTYTPTGKVASKTDDLGRTTVFEYDGHDSLTRVRQADGQSVTFTVDAAGNTTSMTLPSGATTQYVVDGRGNRTSETDPLGRITRYTYDTGNRLISLTNPAGRVTTFQWNNDDSVASVTDPLGRTTQYLYDANANLTSSTDAAGRSTTYVWDALFRLVTVRNPAGGSTSYSYDREDHLTGVTDAAGRSTQFVLDQLGQLTGITDSAGQAWTRAYDAVGNLLRQTDPTGAISTRTFDALDQVTSETGPTGIFARSEYDLAGRLVSSSDAAGHTTRYSYDSFDRITAVTDALGNRTEYRYDVDGNVVGMIDRLGKPTLFTRDAAGQLTSVTDALGQVTSYGYDLSGNLTVVTDPLGNITRTGFDAANQPTSVTNALGKHTTRTYDAAGNVASTTDANGHTSTFTWTALNQLASSTNALGAVTSYSYDASGQLLSRTDPLGNTTSYRYDALGSLASVTDAAGNVTRYSYDALGSLASVTNANGKVTKYRHDAAGQLLEQTDALGNRTSTEYNNVGLPSRVITPTGASISYAHTALGDVASQTSASGVVSFEYDAEQRLIAASNTAGATGWTYTATGQVASQIDPKGKTLSYSYDGAGRLTGLGLPDGSALEYTLNAAGDTTQLSSPWGNAEYAFDPVGRVESIARSNDVTTEYDYDAVGQVTGISTSAPVPTVEISDPAGPVSRAGGCPVVTRANTRALLASNVDRDGCVRVGTYLSRRTLPVSSALAAGASLSLSYTYDLAGNVTSSDRVASVPDAAAPSGARVVDELASSNRYNVLNQLVGSVTNTGAANAYGYDAVGNRTSWEHTAATSTSGVLDPVLSGSAPFTPIAGVAASTAAGSVRATDSSFTQTQVFNALNQLTRSTTAGTGPAVATNFEYDKAGNRTAATSAAGTAGYDWNELGQLTGVSGNGLSSTFGYDALGRRTSETTAGAFGSATSTSVWDGLTPLQTSNSVAGTTTMVSDMTGQLLQGAESSTEGVWSLLDRLGSVLAQVGETDSTVAALAPDRFSQVSQFASYSDFGTATNSTSGWSSQAGLTGQPTSASAAASLFYSRGYEPGTGSWLSADQYPGTQASPLSQNRYAYVSGNPLSFADLLGFRPIGKFDNPGGRYASNVTAVARANAAATARLTGQANAWISAGRPEVHTPSAASVTPPRHEEWWNPGSWSGDTWQNIGATVAGIAVGLAVIAAVGATAVCAAATAGLCAAALIAGGAATGLTTYGLSAGKKTVEGAIKATVEGAFTSVVGGKVLGAVGGAIGGGVGGAASKAISGAAARAALNPSRVSAAAESQAGQASRYGDITIGKSVPNFETNVSRTEFSENLINAGWLKKQSRDGRVTNFTKNGNKYSLREHSNSYDGWSADYTPAGSPDVTVKIRFGGTGGN